MASKILRPQTSAAPIAEERTSYQEPNLDLPLALNCLRNNMAALEIFFGAIDPRTFVALFTTCKALYSWIETADRHFDIAALALKYFYRYLADRCRLSGRRAFALLQHVTVPRVETGEHLNRLLDRAFAYDTLSFSTDEEMDYFKADFVVDGRIDHPNGRAVVRLRFLVAERDDGTLTGLPYQDIFWIADWMEEQEDEIRVDVVLPLAVDEKHSLSVSRRQVHSRTDQDNLYLLVSAKSQGSSLLCVTLDMKRLYGIAAASKDGLPYETSLDLSDFTQTEKIACAPYASAHCFAIPFEWRLGVLLCVGLHAGNWLVLTCAEQCLHTLDLDCDRMSFLHIDGRAAIQPCFFCKHDAEDSEIRLKPVVRQVLDDRRFLLPFRSTQVFK